MVLMVALTGGADSIDSHQFGGGCYGGNGYGYAGCYGGVFGAGCSGWLASCWYSGGYGNGHGYGHGHGSGYGCSGYGCSGYSYGCHGGGRHGHRGGLFGGRHGRRGHGCSGYGYGCSGNGYGCSGYGNGCSGYGNGCTGYVAACGCAPVVACTGGTGMAPAPVTSGNGNKGDTGNKADDMPKGEKIGEPKEEEMKKVMNAAPGTIIVSLPAGARLSIDGEATSSTASVRTFATPALKTGRSYHYTLRAEITRNGQTVRTERQVPVSAGQTSRVTMEFPAATQSVASR
jgi:uncharacterized protein (TIGR03000 family)